MFPTKRSLAARIEALEEEAKENADEEATQDDRLEVLPRAGLFKPEPTLTEALASRGFVVEREKRYRDAGDDDVLLHPTPAVLDVSQAVLWHTEGPAAAKADVRITWDDDRREQLVTDATHPVAVAHDGPVLPDEQVVVADGDGWEAVAPAERVIENAVLPRAEAERVDAEILGPVPPWIEGADEDDLVKIDAAPVSYGDLRSGTGSDGAGE